MTLFEKSVLQLLTIQVGQNILLTNLLATLPNVDQKIARTTADGVAAFAEQHRALAEQMTALLALPDTK